MTLSKIEMWDVASSLKPGLTWPEFERMWEGFLALKRSKQLQ